jgi:hypothetical protein
MSSPYASDMLPMLPAAAVTPEAARARPAARHGLARGGITLQPGMASFLGRAAHARQPAAEPATAAEGGRKSLICSAELPP